MARVGAATDLAPFQEIEPPTPYGGGGLVPESVRMRPRGLGRLAPRLAEPRHVLESYEDDRLALAVGSAGARAFEILYQRFQQPLFAYCCAILGNREEAEDALQDTMLRAFTALSERSAELRFKPWVYSIARNACIDRIRQRRRTSDVEPTEELFETSPSAEVSTETREAVRTLLGDMTELSESQRSALLMREMSGLSHEEISEALDTTPARSKSLISEARQALTDRALGREMPCEELRSAVEEKGRRVLHGRRLSAHVDTCEICSEFVTTNRRRALAAFVPLLPAVNAQAILARVIASAPVEVGGGVAALLGGIGLKKLLATVAIVSAVGGGSAKLMTEGEGPEGAATPAAARGAVPAPTGPAPDHVAVSDGRRGGNGNSQARTRSAERPTAPATAGAQPQQPSAAAETDSSPSSQPKLVPDIGEAVSREGERVGAVVEELNRAAESLQKTASPLTEPVEDHIQGAGQVLGRSFGAAPETADSTDAGISGAGE